MNKFFYLSCITFFFCNASYAGTANSGNATEKVIILPQCEISAYNINFGTWNRSKYSSGTTVSSGGTISMAGAALTAGSGVINASTNVTPTTTSDKIKYVSGAEAGWFRVRCPESITTITPTVTSATLPTISSNGNLELTIGDVTTSVSTNDKIFGYPLSATFTLGTFGTAASQTYSGSYTIDVSF